MNKTIRIARITLNTYFKLFNRTVDAQGSIPSGPKIIAINHTPGFDPLYLPSMLDEPPHFLLQDGLFKIPVVGWLLKATGQIPVYRGTDRAKEAKEKACSIIREGGTIVIFPEGKDVEFGKRIPAKTGAVRMALETGAPIIPIGLFAPAETLTALNFHWDGSLRSGAWQFSGKSYLRVGAPWHPNTRCDAHAQTEELMDRIYSLVSQAERDSKCESPTLPSLIPQW